jgi:hypothetical protein
MVVPIIMAAHLTMEDMIIKDMNHRKKIVGAVAAILVDVASME